MAIQTLFSCQTYTTSAELMAAMQADYKKWFGEDDKSDVSDESNFVQDDFLYNVVVQTLPVQCHFVLLWFVTKLIQCQLIYTLN